VSGATRHLIARSTCSESQPLNGHLAGVAVTRPLPARVDMRAVPRSYRGGVASVHTIVVRSSNDRERRSHLCQLER
jgi:hypothetical protein